MEALLGTIIILATTAAAVGGLFLVRKKVSYDTLSEHHEVANPMVTTFATLYSVLLGFLVVGSFNKFDNCRMSVQAEANAVADVFHLASGLPASSKVQLQTDCLSYARSVVDDEFPAMSGGKPSTATRAKIETLWTDALAYAPSTAAAANVQEELLTCVRTIFERRQDRLFHMEVGSWPVLWAVLIFGNATTVAFTYFFAMKRIASQMILVGLLSLMLSINVYLVIDFSCPFSGPCAVSSEPLVQQCQRFQERMGAGADRDTPRLNK